MVGAQQMFLIFFHAVFLFVLFLIGCQLNCKLLFAYLGKYPRVLSQVYCYRGFVGMFQFTSDEFRKEKGKCLYGFFCSHFFSKKTLYYYK